MATTPYPFVANAILTASQLNSTFNIPVTTKTASAILVASDAGTRVVMNSASATTITVNTSLFAAGDNLEITNIGAGVCTITAGTATVSTSGTLALVANAGGTLYFTSAGVSVFIASGVTASSSGLVCVKAETTFTGASTATADGIFTSTFSNYRILIKAKGSTSTSLRMQLAVSGTPATTTYSSQVSTIDSTTVSAVRVTSQASFLYGDLVSAYNSFFVVDISSPQLADNTLLVSCASIYTGSILTYDTSGVHATATACDGLVLFPASGTFTGTYAVYGYSKTV